jgi:hypothetical protein
VSDIKVGDRVRIKDSYPEFISESSVTGLRGNTPGAEFTVTEVVDAGDPVPEWGLDDRYYVHGDPNGWAIWESQVEKVEGEQ